MLRFGWVHAMYRRNGLYFDSIHFIALSCPANSELIMNNEDSDKLHKYNSNFVDNFIPNFRNDC